MRRKVLSIALGYCYILYCIRKVRGNIAILILSSKHEEDETKVDIINCFVASLVRKKMLKVYFSLTKRLKKLLVKSSIIHGAIIFNKIKLVV